MNLIHIHLSVSVKEDVISSLSRTCDKELYKTWAISIQQKLRFEISEIPCAQWNGTVRLYRLDPSHRTFGYYSSKQVTKERYWGQQISQMERNISVRPKEMNSDRSKWTTFKAGPEYTGCTKPKWSVPCYVPTEISGILGLMESAPWVLYSRTYDLQNIFRANLVPHLVLPLGFSHFGTNCTIPNCQSNLSWMNSTTLS